MSRTDPSAADVMVRRPAVLPVSASVAEVRAAFGSDHVHMVLLTDGSALLGTLVREDLPPAGPATQIGDGSALALSHLEGRTVGPDVPAAAVLADLVERRSRRMAVVDDHGTLLGLMCLNRRQTAFCSDDDVAARSQERRSGATYR